MTRIMSYDEAVLQIREEVANRDRFIISGGPEDMASALRALGDRRCVVWINADYSATGVFKVDSSDTDGTLYGFSAMITAVTSLFSMDLGIVAAVSKVDGLPDKFPQNPGKDLLCLNAVMPVMAAEAMRVLWPDDTVLPPEDTYRVMNQ